MSKNNHITFWGYLQKYKISIPIIQRDYAQGRIGKEFLRQKFFGSIKYALDNPQTPLVLDFVYGGLSGDEATVYPLDGQQRLTTLWLLHWYIAYKANILADAGKVLSRFHYETRPSSDEFIRKLCSLSGQPEDNTISLNQFIKNQLWFRSSWDSDPTIKAMLTSIQGTEIKDENNNDIVDGLEEVFAECSREGFVSYWKLLTEGEPIVFYEYPLGGDDLPDMDELYVKMNARGKPLSDFENFKADMLDYLKGQMSLEQVNLIGAWFDNGGTDLFWKCSNKEQNNYVVDDVFFAFIQRFFLSRLLKQNHNLNKEQLESKKSFIYLTGSNRVLKYNDFSVYQDLGASVLSNDTVNLLQIMCKSVQNDMPQINNLCSSPFKAQPRPIIIPQYEDKDDKEVVTEIDFKERLSFFCVMLYLENTKGVYDSAKFKDWMRFVWNMIEGSGDSGRDGLISMSNFFSELSKNSVDILPYLNKLPSDTNSSQVDNRNRQFREEIIKAKRICKLRECGDAVSEKELYQAERACFFRGTIRFLYTDKDGIVNWNNFDKKLEGAKCIFDADGVSSTYKENSRLLCHFISLQTKWMQLSELTFSNKADDWRWILTRRRFRESIHEILMNPESVSTEHRCYQSRLEAGYEDIQRKVHEDLCNNELMNNIVDTMDNKGQIRWRYQCYCVFPSNAKADWKKYVLATPRNRILFELVKNEIIHTDTDRRIGDSGFLWGWDIYFNYDGKKYCWDTYGQLHYLSEKEHRRRIITATNTQEFMAFL